MSQDSQQKLVNAYLDGDLSRRVFIRRLAAGGVSLGAAVSYAQLLAPEVARAGSPGNDHYPLVQLRVVTRDLHDVRKHKRLRVEVTVGEAMRLHISAFLKRGNFLHILGWAGPPTPVFFGPGTHTLRIGLTYPQKLHGLDRAKVFVQAQGLDGDDHYLIALGASSATLRLPRHR